MLRHQGYGACFRTVVTGIIISFVLVAFVDDTDLCITTQSPEDSEGGVVRRKLWTCGKVVFELQAVQ
jgi:hypothetical protein